MTPTTLEPPPATLRPQPTVLHALRTAADDDAGTGITLLPERAGQPEQQRSYRELYARARELAAHLRTLGVRRGDRVLLVFPTSFEFIVAFFAVQLLGAIPVPSYPPDGLRIESGIKRLSHIARRAGTRAILTSRMLRVVAGDVALRAASVRIIHVVEESAPMPAWPADTSAATGLDALAIQPQDTAFIQFTSGSTGRPKGVVLGHDSVTANIRAIGAALEVRPDDVTVGWLPLYHDMGLIGTLLFAVYWQLPLVLMSPTAFLRQPARWLWAIHHHRGTLSPAPNFAYALCVKRAAKRDREHLDLSSWRVALNGAEPVNMGTLRAFEEVYGAHGFRPTTMLPVYGLAEASLAATFPPLGDGPRCEKVDRAQLGRGRAVPASGDAAVEVVAVGRAVPGHDVAVVDDRGKPVPERTVGTVVFRGPSVMRGYFGDPAATESTLRDGWLHTGDLGYLASGSLYIVGRAKDVMIVRGRNIYAEDLERTAELVPDVRPGGTAAFGVYDDAAADERIVLVCESKLAQDPERAALAARIGERIREQHDLSLHEVVIVRPGTIPRTFSGKRQRSLCRDLYQRGALGRAQPTRWQMAGLAARGMAGLALLRARRWLRRAA
jgi:acyl-CoA synthetase (AMP-forming)/AMP-acid ligase II